MFVDFQKPKCSRNILIKCDSTLGRNHVANTPDGSSSSIQCHDDTIAYHETRGAPPLTEKASIYLYFEWLPIHHGLALLQQYCEYLLVT